MLKKVNRLRKTKEIMGVFASRQYRVSPHFRINYDFRGEKAVGQCAVVVSKKTGKATVRNKLRRRVKDIFRRSKLRERPGLRIVISSRKGAEGLEFDGIKKELTTLFANIDSSESINNA